MFFGPKIGDEKKCGICSSCNGSGMNMYSSDDLHCWGCDGTGQGKAVYEVCFYCDGTGKREKQKCDTCNGKGKFWREYGVK